jgi:hypothetical protein
MMTSRGALAIFLLATSLTGCDRLQALYTSKVERINTAFPIPEELVTGQNRLFSDLDDDPAAKKRVGEAYAQLLQVRALTCSTEITIGRFDTAAEIRRKLTNVTCFRDQDQAIQSWVGMQRFIRLTGKPPVVPFADLPARTPILSQPDEQPSQLFIARAANVAVAQSVRSKLSTVELPSGKLRLASYGQNLQIHSGTTLSPNGRILATQANNVLTAIDTETGSVVWSSDKFREVIAWIPEVGITVLAPQKGNGTPEMLDHVRGAIEPYPVPLNRASWAVNMPQMPTRVVIGDASGFAVIDHARAADGFFSAQLVKQFKFEGRGHTSGIPQLMAGSKKLIYVSMNDVGWVDLESGQQGIWQFSAIGGGVFTKLSERQLLTDLRAEGVRSDAHVFDIEQGTLQLVEGSTNDGLLQPLNTRTGFVRRGHESTWVGTTVQLRGEPRSFETLVAERLLAQQLAKVEAAQNALGNPVPGAMPSPSDTGRPWPPTRPMPTAPARPLLTSIPADARVAAIGVYEAAVTTQASTGRIGGIRVTIGPGTSPLVLVLASYEPVNWHIQDNGRKIAAILVSSYGGGSNVSVGGSPNILKANLGYAYQLATPQYQRLEREVAKYVAAPIGSFQGGYRGQDFLVR